MKSKLLILLCILFQFSCKKDLTPRWELTQTERTLIVGTSALPNEPSASNYCYARRVVFYKSLQDLLNSTNEIASLITTKSGGNSPRSVMLTNVKYDEIYIRIQSITYAWCEDKQSFIAASYYYNGVVKMSPYYGQTSFSAESNNLIKEK
jgi:hypothetical protein